MFPLILQKITTAQMRSTGGEDFTSSRDGKDNANNIHSFYATDKLPGIQFNIQET